MPRLWRINLVGEQSTKYVGIVTTPDEEIAIKRAREKFDIVDPKAQLGR
jgi:hypothetical protein